MMKLATSSWSAASLDVHEPSPGSPRRSEYIRWLFFAVTQLAPSVLEAVIAEERADEAALATARRTFSAHATVLESALEPGPHLLGEELTAADLKVGSVLAWATSVGLVARDSRLARYAQRVLGRTGE